MLVIVVLLASQNLTPYSSYIFPAIVPEPSFLSSMMVYLSISHFAYIDLSVVNAAFVQLAPFVPSSFIYSAPVPSGFSTKPLNECPVQVG